MRKSWFKLGGVCGIVLAIITVWFSVCYLQFLRTPLSSQAICYVFNPGTAVRSLSVELHQRGWLLQPNFFLLLVYIKGVAAKLKAGSYCFAPGTTPSQLLDKMVAGQVVPYRFTIVEGWTMQQVYEALARVLPIEQTKDIRSPENREGLFFPATYYYYPGMSGRALLDHSLRLMQKRLTAAWQKRAPNLPYKTPYKALIAASLVEKETIWPKDKPLVAGVIKRRLQRNMPLQFDTSVIYGLGLHYTGKLRHTDLRRDTVYNTYTRRGLPPTPIAIPSLSSIEAVLHPDDSNQALYFVAQRDGSLYFSNDFISHRHAAQRYRRWQMIDQPARWLQGVGLEPCPMGSKRANKQSGQAYEAAFSQTPMSRASLALLNNTPVVCIRAPVWLGPFIQGLLC